MKRLKRILRHIPRFQSPRARRVPPVRGAHAGAHEHVSRWDALSADLGLALMVGAELCRACAGATAADER